MVIKLIFSLLTIVSALPAARAIVFDFGGVMTIESNREVVVNFLCRSFSLSQEQFEVVNQQKRAAVKEGKTDEEFWLKYAAEHDVWLPEDWTTSFHQVMKQAIGVNSQMYELVNELKTRNMPIALLSNIDERLGKIIRDFGLYEPFEPCLLSYQLGLEKPDPQIYQVLLKEMNLPAEDIIFIDDRAENIEAAKHLGLDAILFLSPCQLKNELAIRGIHL